MADGQPGEGHSPSYFCDAMWLQDYTAASPFSKPLGLEQGLDVSGYSNPDASGNDEVNLPFHKRRGNIFQDSYHNTAHPDPTLSLDPSVAFGLDDSYEEMEQVAYQGLGNPSLLRDLDRDDRAESWLKGVTSKAGAMEFICARNPREVPILMKLTSENTKVRIRRRSRLEAFYAQLRPDPASSVLHAVGEITRMAGLYSTPCNDGEIGWRQDEGIAEVIKSVMLETDHDQLAARYTDLYWTLVNQTSLFDASTGKRRLTIERPDGNGKRRPTLTIGIPSGWLDFWNYFVHGLAQFSWTEGLMVTCGCSGDPVERSRDHRSHIGISDCPSLQDEFTESLQSEPLTIAELVTKYFEPYPSKDRCPHCGEYKTLQRKVIDRLPPHLMVEYPYQHRGPHRIQTMPINVQAISKDLSFRCGIAKEPPAPVTYDSVQAFIMLEFDQFFSPIVAPQGSDGKMLTKSAHLIRQGQTHRPRLVQPKELKACDSAVPSGILLSREVLA